MITKQQPGNSRWGMAESLYDKVEDYKTYTCSCCSEVRNIGP
jgi:hypothetical protein